MADTYQKDSKAASFKKHKEVAARSAEISVFLVDAEPGGRRGPRGPRGPRDSWWLCRAPAAGVAVPTGE